MEEKLIINISNVLKYKERSVRLFWGYLELFKGLYMAICCVKTIARICLGGR